mgnify:FL=1
MQSDSQILNVGENDSVDVVKEARYYLFFWPWFLLSIVLFILSTYFYLRYSQTIYQTTAVLQVKDASSDPASFLTASKSPMFNFNSVKLDNFIAQIKAKQNLSSVVENLDLQTSVFRVGRIMESIAYGDEIPFSIIFKSTSVFNKIGLELSPNNGTIEFKGIKKTFDLSEPLETEDFILIVNKEILEESTFFINRNPDYKLINSLSNQIKVSSNSKTGDNIDITIEGSNPKRNESILNSLIDAFEKQQIKDKQKIFSLSIDFINERLVIIKNEIDSLSFQSIGFRSDNSIFSAEAQTSTALSSISTIDQQQFSLATQKALATSLKEDLEDQDDFSLLPSNIGIESGNVNELVLSYNELVLERKNLLAGATTKNPLIIQISDQLNDFRRNIFTSINNYISSIDTSLAKFNEYKSRTSNEVSKIPGLEATLLGFERKFQIAEKLYLFLLERREEASISYESTLPNTRVINYAHTNLTPVAPKKQIIVLGSVLLALLIPFGVIYILKLIDTKIHTREDLENLIPNLDVLGEIPFVEDIKTVNNSRGVFAESSRVIRSNISFKLPEKENGSVILSTSSIKGEGKTITAFNTAASYVATGKKVLLIGADLRNPQVHKLLNIDRKSNTKGLSNLLSNPSIEFSSDYVIHSFLFDKPIDLMLSGPIPPNPAELLGSDAFSSLLANLRELYDYIVIDSAPLVLVSDTIPMLKHADLVLYTVRANHTDKKLAPFFNSLVNDKKVNNIGVVLNGIKGGANSYYKYGYGYRYSYQYKYNYGYGYGYGSDKSS